MTDMNSSSQEAVRSASELMSAYAKRTGIEGAKDNASRRYLWTDAFALLNFLALHKNDTSAAHDEKASRLIHEVHHNLGKFAANDKRSGWISGLDESEAEKHPTIAGLRIGKKLPERGPHDPFDQRLEWERDGQYYHYHTRWITALSAAARNLDQDEFERQAAELSFAGSNFIDRQPHLRMYWKMSVDLTRPLDMSMGAHDPMEGLLCAIQSRNTANTKLEEFDKYISELETLCDGRSWVTTDALGLGGLLLNVVRAAKLEQHTEIPSSVGARKLLTDTERGLKNYLSTFHPQEPAGYRLAFRECGLSLGLRVFEGCTDDLEKQGLATSLEPEVFRVADQIEAFWNDSDNQKASTFRDHLDINEISLASSLLAKGYPEVFAGA